MQILLFSHSDQTIKLGENAFENFPSKRYGKHDIVTVLTNNYMRVTHIETKKMFKFTPIDWGVISVI